VTADARPELPHASTVVDRDESPGPNSCRFVIASWSSVVSTSEAVRNRRDEPPGMDRLQLVPSGMRRRGLDQLAQRRGRCLELEVVRGARRCQESEKTRFRSSRRPTSRTPRRRGSTPSGTVRSSSTLLKSSSRRVEPIAGNGGFESRLAALATSSDSSRPVSAPQCTRRRRCRRS